MGQARAIGIRPADVARIGRDGTLAIAGARCENGDYTTVAESFRCPRCFGAMLPAEFVPRGTVWSYTTVLVPSPNRVPPYALAYVDLDDGPRILCDAPPATRRVGARVSIGISGDVLTATVVDGAA